ncbi:hypothetical protein FRC01_006237 [Tulasnella sp. 417]|nr:hypothetical protein FRC01_006237 [Tulasnella sp. 417]
MEARNRWWDAEEPVHRTTRHVRKDAVDYGKPQQKDYNLKDLLKQAQTAKVVSRPPTILHPTPLPPRRPYLEESVEPVVGQTPSLERTTPLKGYITREVESHGGERKRLERKLEEDIESRKLQGTTSNLQAPDRTPSPALGEPSGSSSLSTPPSGSGGGLHQPRTFNNQAETSAFKQILRVPR